MVGDMDIQTNYCSIKCAIRRRMHRAKAVEGKADSLRRWQVGRGAMTREDFSEKLESNQFLGSKS